MKAQIRLPRPDRGFSLVMTLIIMALLMFTVVGYLITIRGDRVSSKFYADSMRAKMVADTGLSAAVSLLKDNTRYGNYITAMYSGTAPLIAPGDPIMPEIYRPDPLIESGSTASYLKITGTNKSNGVGTPLVSLSSTNAQSQVDSRPTPAPAVIGTNFAVALPTFSATNSYNFNQVVRLGGTTGYLVEPKQLGTSGTNGTVARPAYGQWVRVRDSSGKLIGRFAYFIEDESMKINLNVAGNTMGSGSTQWRVNDITTPASSPVPSAVQQIDPSIVIAGTGTNTTAIRDLVASGTAARMPTKGTIAAINSWSPVNYPYPYYSHMVTVQSKDDLTTARGWKRMNLNKVVADAQSEADKSTDPAVKNAAKVDAAKKISNWIRDAWTGPKDLSSLTDERQIYGDERLRLQLAANIVDYVDTDDIPTDLGDYKPAGSPPAVPATPILGIEKLPYLIQIEIIYTASNVILTGSSGQADLAVSAKLSFGNMYDTSMTLGQYMSKIDITGIPTLVDDVPNPPDSSILDVSKTTYSVKVGGSTTPFISDTGLVPSGPDAVTGGTASAKTFDTGPLFPKKHVTFSTADRPRFLDGLLDVVVYGPKGERIDVNRVVLNSQQTGDTKPSNGSVSTGHFLKNGTSTASINLLYYLAPGTTNPLEMGDPRFRPTNYSLRWNNMTRTDPKRVNDFVDSWENNLRAWSVDWYDYVGDRPMAKVANAPMQKVGELGNICLCEYPWRSIYLQYPERVTTATETGPVTDVPARRVLGLDYAVLDLFKTSDEDSRVGGINVNTRYGSVTVPGLQCSPISALFLGLSAGGGLPGATTENVSLAGTKTMATSVFTRRSPTGTFPDNQYPVRPFFQSGELASVMSRDIARSTANKTSGSPSRTQVDNTVLTKQTNYGRDDQVEQEFREVSNAITTRGNVFRVLYVGQTVKDLNNDGSVDEKKEVFGEYFGEAFVERIPSYAPLSPGSDTQITADSSYQVISRRQIFE